MMNKNFKIVNSFKGFGEPKNSIWFIGIEEGGKFTQDIVNKYSKGIIYVKDENVDTNKKSPIYQIISKIMVQLLPVDSKNSLDWQEYRDTKLFRRGENVFQTNLFPLGRRNTKTWYDDYKELFGFDKNDFKKYIEAVREKRFPMLYNYWLSNKPKLTICFGSTYWNYFSELLHLDEKNFLPKDNSYIKFDKSKNVILTPFFSNWYMNTNRIQFLIDLIKKNKMVEL